MLDALLDRWISQLTEHDGGVSLDRAREIFHGETGPFDVGERWYEPRLRFFFEWFLCDFGGAEAWLATHPEADERERLVAHACMTSARSLYTVSAAEQGKIQLEDRLGGGRFVIAAAGAAERLTPGETFDGRLLVLGELELSRGIIFHTPEARVALDALLEEIAPVEGDRTPILSGLLRMRMRLDRFTSIRAEHIYRIEGLHNRSINSAVWAQKA